MLLFKKGKENQQTIYFLSIYLKFFLPIVPQDFAKSYYFPLNHKNRYVILLSEVITGKCDDL